MASDKQLPIDKEKYDELVDKCLEIIKKYKIFFIQDIVAYLPFSRKTFYLYELHKSDDIKEAIENNRIQAKQLCKAKWFESKNPILQLAFYKLISTPDERNALSSNPRREAEEQNTVANALDKLANTINKDMAEHGDI